MMPPVGRRQTHGGMTGKMTIQVDDIGSNIPRGKEGGKCNFEAQLDTRLSFEAYLAQMYEQQRHD